MLFALLSVTALAQTPFTLTFTNYPAAGVKFDVTPVNGQTITYEWENISNTAEKSAAPISVTTTSLTATDAAMTGKSIRLKIRNATVAKISTNAANLATVENWGSTNWTSFKEMFKNASNLTALPTANPTMSGVTDMSSMFEGCSKLNTTSTLNWNTANVTNMANLFKNATLFNADITSWPTSLVTNMTGMFEGAKAFNRSINYRANTTPIAWSTYSVTNMANMFKGAEAFNGDISNWIVSNVTNMSSMFEGAKVFNATISNWDVAKVTTMASMFKGALAFNAAIGSWNVAKVTTMANMFDGSTAFNASIANWTPTVLTTANRMFNGATAFNQTFGTTWATNALADISFMFNGATAFNSNVDNLKLTNGTVLESVFQGATAFNQPINWNLTNVTSLKNLFNGAAAFNSNIASWNVVSVTDMTGLFYGATSFNVNIAGWTTSNLKLLQSTFRNATSFNQNISSWNTANVTDMQWIFNGATSFNQNISGWNTAKVTSFASGFFNASSFNQSLGAWSLKSLSTSGIRDALTFTALSIVNYDSTLQGWINGADTPNGISFQPNNLKYSATGAIYRQRLISEKGWAITGDVLPVKLVAFDIANQQSGVLAKWTTASEQNNAYFTLERSTDGTNFTKVATVFAKGEPANYQALDKLPNAGLNYYRLVQTDLNGDFEILGTKVINFNLDKVLVKAYPNPMVNELQLTSATGVFEKVSITTANGRMVYSNTAKEANLTVDVSALPKGIYLVNTTVSGVLNTFKVIK